MFIASAFSIHASVAMWLNSSQKCQEQFGHGVKCFMPSYGLGTALHTYLCQKLSLDSI